MRARWFGVVCMLPCIAQAAGPAQDEALQRERLAGERAAAQARYEQAVRGCEAGFVVTGCINQAKAERRATLDRVAREQAALNDAVRKRSADERRQRIASKQQAAALRAAASAPAMQLRTPKPTASSASAARPVRQVEPRSSEAAAAAQADAAQRSAQAQQRRERAQAHADAVRQRNNERALQKPPAAPLPARGASVVPRSAAAAASQPAAPASAALE
jgi:colicin import membrane protein